MIRKTGLPLSELDGVLLEMNLRCVYVHRAEEEDHWECDTHTHEYMEIGYIFKGTGSYHIDGIRYEARAGDVYIIPARTPHFEVNHPESPFEILFLMVEHQGREREKLETMMQQLKGRVDSSRKVKIRELFEGIFEDVVLQQDGYLSSIDARLKLLYILLLRERDPGSAVHPAASLKWSSAERNSYMLEQIRNYLVMHLGDRCSLEAVAQKFFYHPKYFSQWIKKETGKSLSEWIFSLRIAKAKELLSQGDESIEQISGQLGFSSVQHFYKRFRKEAGMTPNEYRNHLLHAPRDPF